MRLSWPGARSPEARPTCPPPLARPGRDRSWEVGSERRLERLDPLVGLRGPDTPVRVDPDQSQHPARQPPRRLQNDVASHGVADQDDALESEALHDRGDVLAERGYGPLP